MITNARLFLIMCFQMHTIIFDFCFIKKPSSNCELKDEFGSIQYVNVNWENVMRDTNQLIKNVFTKLDIEVNKCWSKDELTWCEMVLFVTDPKYYVNDNYNVVMIGLDYLLKWYGEKKTNRLGKEFEPLIDALRVKTEFKLIWPNLSDLAKLFVNIKDDDERIASFWEVSGIQYGNNHIQLFELIEITFANPPQSVLNEH